ncbi:hypothetical protein E1301_Tti013212 [Triplophysa tibetana]|uniref:Uncharacterized protein n=1 Tax=Triplophysa tibetana TaxID=1572043 RepID=A0A5A9NK02_9TELE|nr:hypothetical protein E1301_Tti013212 [Triplophysa tibetana]
MRIMFGFAPSRRTDLRVECVKTTLRQLNKLYQSALEKPQHSSEAPLDMYLVRSDKTVLALHEHKGSGQARGQCRRINADLCCFLDGQRAQIFPLVPHSLRQPTSSYFENSNSAPCWWIQTCHRCWGSADRGKMKSLWRQHVAMHFYGISSQHPDSPVGPVPVAMAIQTRSSLRSDSTVHSKQDVVRCSFNGKLPEWLIFRGTKPTFSCSLISAMSRKGAFFVLFVLFTEASDASPSAVCLYDSTEDRVATGSLRQRLIKLPRIARITTPRRLDTEQAIIVNLNEVCSASSRQPLQPALPSLRSTPNHSLACFYFMHYFSPDTSTLSSKVSGFGQPDSVKLTGVGMREGFASSSQRGSREIIMQTGRTKLIRVGYGRLSALQMIAYTPLFYSLTRRLLRYASVSQTDLCARLTAGFLIFGTRWSLSIMPITPG